MAVLVTSVVAPSKIGAPTSGVQMVLCDDDIPVYSISLAVAFQAASPYERQVWRRWPAWRCVA
eukprot:4542694-Pleurochrysis_carterae.AAC.1